MTPDEKLTLIREKIKRAKKHLADLEIARDEFFAQDFYEAESYDDPQAGERIFKMLRVDPVCARIPLIIGDALHNVRSALDHLAWQLSATPNHDTMFPVFGNAAECVAMNTGKVQGMSQSAKDKIRDAEPYKNGKGHDLWVLNKLDIADKHHALLANSVCNGLTFLGHGPVTSGPMYTEVVTIGGGAKLFGEPLKAGDVFLTLPKGHPYQNVRFTFDISISEPNVIINRPVVFFVSILIARVDRLVLEFEPELK